MTNPTFERAIEAVSNTASDCPDQDNFKAVARAVLLAVRSEVVAELGEECETDRVLSAILADGGE